MAKSAFISFAKILAGQQQSLHLGNSNAKRDWGYAPEFVEGMWLMLQQEVSEDYVLATGTTTTVRDFLELCLKHAGFIWERTGSGKEEKYIDKKTGKIIVQTDPHYYRPAEVDVLLGDPSKAAKKLGWHHKTTVDELARIMMEADCKALGVKC